MNRTGNRTKKTIRFNQLTRETPHSETNAFFELLGKEHVTRENLTFLRKNLNALAIIAKAIRVFSKDSEDHLFFERMTAVKSILEHHGIEYGVILQVLEARGWVITHASINDEWIEITTSSLFQKTIYELRIIVRSKETFEEISLIRIYRSERIENPKGIAIKNTDIDNVSMDDFYKLLDNPAIAFEKE